VKHAQPQRRRPDSEDDTIDLRVILSLIRGRWLWLLVSFLVGAVLVFAVSAFYMPKVYQSSIELYVNSTDKKTSSDVTSAELQASKSLAGTYIVVLENPSVLEEVSAEIGGALTRGQLVSVLTMSPVNATEVIRIVARTTDPVLSAKICNAYAKIAPEVLERVVQAGSVEIIGSTYSEPGPVSPNVPRNTLLGALAGLVLCLAFIFVRYALDNTVKNGFDLSQRIDVPVLGQIPSFKSASTKGSAAAVAAASPAPIPTSVVTPVSTLAPTPERTATSSARVPRTSSSSSAKKSTKE
jgi:capsular polysaccharide biosynthesis protein